MERGEGEIKSPSSTCINAAPLSGPLNSIFLGLTPNSTARAKTTELRSEGLPTVDDKKNQYFAINICYLTNYILK